MKNIVEVIKLNDNLEEEAFIMINNIEFVTFVAYAPYQINSRQQYPVEISFFVDEVDIHECANETKELIREENTFKYTISGYLNHKGQLDIGFIVEDELFEDYQYLCGTYITFKVDRINSEFLETGQEIVQR